MSAALRLRLALAMVATAALLALPTAARAADIEVSGATLRVNLLPPPAGASGNSAQVSQLSDGGALVTIYGQTVTATTIGAGCQQVSTSNAPGTSIPFVVSGPSKAATCGMSGVRVIEGTLRAPAMPSQGWESFFNLPTKVTSTGGVAPGGVSGDIIFTGAGGDTVTGGDGNDRIDAGGAPYKGEEAFPPSGNPALDDPDRNFVTGGGGADTFALAFGKGRDVVSGGAGVDLATYEGRFTVGSPGSAGVHVTLDDVANDGDPNIDPPDSTAPGEGDNVKPDVENLTGTKREDRLIGSSLANVLYGDEGVDNLSGGAGEDLILAREPALAGSGTADVISCGSPTPIQTKTTRFGVISGTTGTDRLEKDLADPRPADCELLVDMAVDEPAPIKIARTARRASKKRLRVRLTCPRAAKRTCKGKLRLAGKRSGSRAAKFSIKGGAKRTVTLKLSAKAAKALARRRVLARLVSKEKGLKGEINRVALARVRG